MNLQTLRTRCSRVLGAARGLPIIDGLAQASAPCAAVCAAPWTTASNDTLTQEAQRLRGLASDSAGADSSADFRGAVFALGAEFCRRELNLEPFAVQIAAAEALARGQIVQMATGEGKTLAIALAAALAALDGTPVAVFTANDYLARRDAEGFGPFYRRWGLSVSAVTADDSAETRRRAYRSNIVYQTVREGGFDFLRDSLALNTAERLQPQPGSALVDEADLLMIDEARIPLVLAGILPAAGGTPVPDLSRYAAAAEALCPGIDLETDPAGRRLSLTLEGERRAAALLGLTGRHHPADLPHFARLHAALHARHLLERDRDYVVRSGRVELIDSFTGRVADRRNWPWGIQAAVEHQEGLVPGPEGQILNRITVQDYLRQFRHLAGTTATAETAAGEFRDAYGLTIADIPPRLPCRRIDEPDQVFRTRSDKLAALGDQVAAAHGRGRPVLVATGSVAESEAVGTMLNNRGIECAVLNARQDAAEAAVIARAGRLGAVTVSTEMAGRGTDIRLGNPDCPGEAEAVADLGGLLVIGTARRENRRLDGQLRGRAGRQGDPGASRFLLSLEDSLFVRYGVAEFLPPWPADAVAGAPAISPRFGAEIDRAVRIIEYQNRRLRRSLGRFSELLEIERRMVAAARDDLVAAGLHPGPLDTFWADHLAWSDDLREGVHLLALGGRDPILEFNRLVAERFEAELNEALDSAHPFDTTTAHEHENFRPGTVWTYAVEDEAPPDFTALIAAGAAAGLLALARLPARLAAAVAALARRLNPP